MEKKIVYSNRIQLTVNNDEGIFRFLVQAPEINQERFDRPKTWKNDESTKWEILDETVVYLSRSKVEEFYQLLGKLISENPRISDNPGK
ncbi:MAG: hypothetical protein ABFD07_07610 [Methanobacterium sp.]